MNGSIHCQILLYFFHFGGAGPKGQAHLLIFRWLKPSALSEITGLPSRLRLLNFAFALDVLPECVHQLRAQFVRHAAG